MPLNQPRALRHASSRARSRAPVADALVPLPDRFAALDFETANVARDSACAVALVVVEQGVVVDTYSTLLHPPSLWFQFTSIHGITAAHVADAPSYEDVHGEILARLDGCAFIAAHNASFDASVMRALCARYALPPPDQAWRCTVKMARARWGLRPARLPDVCNHLAIALKHHDATSDATACARIVVAALDESQRQVPNPSTAIRTS